jgi:type IV secretory pathway VirB3-like protein
MEDLPPARREESPLPKAKMFVLLLVVFVEAMFNSMLYPFVAYMVHDFFYWLSKDDPDADRIVSFYAGLVASCFSFA